MLAGEIEPFTRPALPNDLYLFFKPANPLFYRYVERSEVHRLVPQPYAQDEAAPRNDVQRYDVLSHLHRMMQRQQNNRRAQVQRGRLGSHGGGNDQRRRQEPILVLVMLAEGSTNRTPPIRRVSPRRRLLQPPGQGSRRPAGPQWNCICQTSWIHLKCDSTRLENNSICRK